MTERPCDAWQERQSPRRVQLGVPPRGPGSDSLTQDALVRPGPRERSSPRRRPTTQARTRRPTQGQPTGANESK
eukprot:3507145-Alexandrium_andersonii.AAC.1